MHDWTTDSAIGLTNQRPELSAEPAGQPFHVHKSILDDKQVKLLQSSHGWGGPAESGQKLPHFPHGQLGAVETARPCLLPADADPDGVQPQPSPRVGSELLKDPLLQVSTVNNCRWSSCSGSCLGNTGEIVSWFIGCDG